MKTPYKNFIAWYNKKKEYDKDIAEKPKDVYNDGRPRIKFHLAYSSVTPFPASGIDTSWLHSLFVLDDEDIEYFRDKYQAKLDEELQEKIEELKREYYATTT